MVSGNVEVFLHSGPGVHKGYNFGKNNRNGTRSPSLFLSPHQNRFSDGPLRPWPPMYNSYHSSLSKPVNVNLNNLSNSYTYNAMKSNTKSNNKYPFHQNIQDKGKMGNLSPLVKMNISGSKDQIVMHPYFYNNMTNGVNNGQFTHLQKPIYGGLNKHENGLIMIDKEKDKLRKLR